MRGSEFERTLVRKARVCAGRGTQGVMYGQVIRAQECGGGKAEAGF